MKIDMNLNHDYTDISKRTAQPFEVGQRVIWDWDIEDSPYSKYRQREAAIVEILSQTGSYIYMTLRFADGFETLVNGIHVIVINDSPFEEGS